MNEEEIMQGINTIIAFMKEELKAEHSCFTIKELWAAQGLLDLYNQEKEQNEMLINEKNIYKDLTKQAQEDVTIWKNLYKQEKEKNKVLEEKLKIAKQLYNDACVCIATDCVKKDKLKDMMKYREFELQQEYKEFEEDVEWRTYKKILEV